MLHSNATSGITAILGLKGSVFPLNAGAYHSNLSKADALLSGENGPGLQYQLHSNANKEQQRLGGSFSKKITYVTAF